MPTQDDVENYDNGAYNEIQNDCSEENAPQCSPETIAGSVWLSSRPSVDHLFLLDEA